MEPYIFKLPHIKNALKDLDTIKAIEDGFVAYSRGRTIIPPVGELLFSDPPGDAHIKYGYIKDEEYYVIKIASGFYENVKEGLPSGDGLMLLFNQRTGQLSGILLDEGHLTNVRTAAAGAVAAKHLAPEQVDCIGVFGTGIQGKMQVQYLSSVTPCRDIMVWGINMEECKQYKKEMEDLGYFVQIDLEPGKIAENCNLIITATPSTKPLLKAGTIRMGTHITAIGSDTPEKNELDPSILKKADIIAADSIDQCKTRGEIFKAVSTGVISIKKPVELGDIISGKISGRTHKDQITIADLTGVAVQDIQISVAVFNKLISINKGG